jgi:hypothetical protein
MLDMKPRTLIGLFGLTVALTGCPGDDSGGDDANTTASTIGNTTGASTGADDDGGPGTTAGDDSPATSDESTGGPGDDTTTGNPVTCEPACAANENCIAGNCIPTGDCLPECTGEDTCVDGVCVPPVATNADYGPCGMCAPGEMAVQIMGIEGCFCSPACGGAMMDECPAPNEGTSQGACVLGVDPMMPTQCALVCNPAMPDCPTGATCQDTGMMGVGLCTHPAA